MPDSISLAMRGWDLKKKRLFSDNDGLACVSARSAEVDRIVARSFSDCFPEAEKGGIAAVAVGGYGRSQLFPHSDVDLLILFSDDRLVAQSEGALARLLAGLWDAKLRVSHSVRTPKDCTTITPENAELNISLLDSRFLAGDRDLFGLLHGQQLPQFYLREQDPLTPTHPTPCHRGQAGIVERQRERMADLAGCKAMLSQRPADRMRNQPHKKF